VRQGKDVKIVCVGKKATAQLRRLYADRIVENFDLSAYRQFTLSVAQPIADVVTRLYEHGDVDVVTLFYSRFKSVVQQTPTALQLIPATSRAPSPRPALRRSTSMSPRKRKSSRPCCRAT
jgi:F-type H+-transporting ATPase subunit gamma